jgi:hypothetical protein
LHLSPGVYGQKNAGTHKDPCRKRTNLVKSINTYRGKRSDGEITVVLENASNILATHYLPQSIKVSVDMVEGQRYSETLEFVAQGRALYLSKIPNPQESEKNPPHTHRFVANS